MKKLNYLKRIEVNIKVYGRVLSRIGWGEKKVKHWRSLDRIDEEIKLFKKNRS